jgi:hypothetical protein
MRQLINNREFKPSTVIQRKSGLLYNDIDGEIVMLSIENSEYYGFDKVGSRIWELIKEPVTLRFLTGRLMEEYEVGEEQCRTETLGFINKLADKKLLVN